jgi:iron complex transport system substrate-binding protein
MNPCVDAILREVAAPGQIASISHYSQDSRATSVPLDWARDYRANNGSAEDVIAAGPDLVIAGPHVAVQTVAALERLGIPLIQVPVPQSIAESRAQIDQIAQRIGQPAAGRAAMARIDTALAGARWNGRPASALIWQGGGLVPGAGTLADDLLARSGFANAAPALGLGQWDVLQLEGLLMGPPQVVLSGDANMDSGGADANRMLSHPALRKAGARIHLAHYPSNLLHCGGPVIVPALARLAQVRRELEARR